MIAVATRGGRWRGEPSIGRGSVAPRGSAVPLAGPARHTALRFSHDISPGQAKSLYGRFIPRAAVESGL
jgi:hypothetical protein